MRILILTYMDPVRANSAASITLNRLLTEWQRRGHDITLFYSDGIEDYGTSDEVMATRLAPLRKFKIPTSENRFPFNILFRLSGLRQLPDLSVSNHFRLIRAIVGNLREESNYDFILSWSFRHSIHLAAMRIAELTKIPWFVSLSDPWADNGTGFGDYGRLELAINRIMERRVFAGASAIFFTTDAIRELVMRKYPASWNEKTLVIVTGYDATLYPARVRPSGAEISIRYIGALYGTRSPESLFCALGHVPGSILDRIRFRFVTGNGPLIEQTARHYRVSSDLFQVVPPVSYIESLREMQDADVLLSIDGTTERNIFLPSKLVDYVGTGNMIWAITSPGASADFVRNVGGIVSDLHDPEKIARDLANIATRLARSTDKCKINQRAAQFSVSQTSEAMLAAIEARI